MERLRKLIRTLLALMLVAGAVGATAYLLTTRPEPPRSAEAAPLPEVLVFEAAPQLFDAPIVGYGTIKPRNQVKIVPQVSGMLVDTHPDLAVGNVVPKGEVLFKIDPRPYESRVLQGQADIKMLEVQLERFEQQKKNLTARLGIAEEQAEIAKRDLETEANLRTGGAGTGARVDAARQEYLRAQDVVLGYESQLALIPHQIDETKARLEARRAQLADAKRDLDHTAIVSPFDARVDLVSARTSQVVVANFAIAALTDLSVLELAAVLDPAELQWAERKAYARVMGGDLGEPPAVTVSWTLHDQRYSWTGQVSRLERHDELTRTARVVVEIPQSLKDIRASEVVGRPTLSVGMFCAAEIPAEPLPDALVLPRSAIRQGNFVYVFAPDSPDARTGRLALRRVPILRNVNDRVLIDFAGRSDDDRLLGRQALAQCELRPGDLVITSPLPRPVAGMKLRLRGGEPSVPETLQAMAVYLEAAAFDHPLRNWLARSPTLAVLPPFLTEVAAGDW